MAKIIAFTGNAGAKGNDNVPLVDRLAFVLAEIVDNPLVVLPNDPDCPGLPTELRLSHFNRELAEQASQLLEEAGW